jgi:cysteinyl-tRNA synthetase, unknown class
MASGGEARGAPSRLTQVKSWGYQLQGARGAKLDLDALERSPFDLVVVDAADRGEPLSPEAVGRLKRRPGGGRRFVLAYVSIGEAEDYRAYWDPAWAKRPPRFLAAENPEWRGNWKVRYWDPDWRRIVLGYVDQVAAAGFDGAYLDVIDAYDYFGPRGRSAERPTAARDMADLVIAVARHARKARPSFVIVPQNGAAILAEIPAALATEYLACIDGIGAEDSFFYGDRPEDNRLDVQTETLEALARFTSAGKVVLAVDYLTDKKKARRFVELARERGFLPYVGRRALDRLVLDQPGRDAR